MKNQALFSSKDKIKKLKCRLLQCLFSALRVNQRYSLNAKSLWLLLITKYEYLEIYRKDSKILPLHLLW